MARIFISLNVPDGTYGECVQAPCVDPRYGDGHTDDKLWVIHRRAYPTGLFWPSVTINTKSVLLDQSLPTRVDKLPRDAREVSPEHAAQLWHEDNESHVFGGPNVAKALRESIAAANAR